METATLQFDSATIEDDDYYDGGLSSVTFLIRPGQCVLIRTEPGQRILPFADLAQGLASVSRGSVTYCGETWESMKPDRATANRAKTRRVFADEGWVSNLDVDENVTLSERHFSKRPESDIAAEANTLAKAFGLDQLPQTRPAWLKRRDLIIAGWVRALLGEPQLILLEHPCRDAYADQIPAFIEALSKRREQGAAVLWLTAEDAIWRNKEIRADKRLKMKGEEVHPG